MNQILNWSLIERPQVQGLILTLAGLATLGTIGFLEFHKTAQLEKSIKQQHQQKASVYGLHPDDTGSVVVVFKNPALDVRRIDVAKDLLVFNNGKLQVAGRDFVFIKSEFGLEIEGDKKNSVGTSALLIYSKNFGQWAMLDDIDVLER